MSHDSVPTIKIWTANGPVIINAADFDAATHTRAADDESGPAAGEQSSFTLAPASEPPAVVVPQSDTDANGNPNNQQPPAVAPVPPAPAPAAALLVLKTGKKFHVVDKDGAAVVRDGIESDGYKTEGEAWAAVMALAPAV